MLTNVDDVESKTDLVCATRAGAGTCGPRKSFVWNFKELFRQGALYRALPTALVGSVPKAVIHYSILNFYINTFAPEGDIKKADGQTATVIGAWAHVETTTGRCFESGL